jgi:glycosyltransferase involved in cell wall biosynthesis
MNAELARRFGRGSRPLRAYLTALEAHLLRSSDAIVAISEDFLPTLSGWRVAAHKTSVIPNWAPLDEIPQLPRVNRWSKEHGVADKFTFLYTGTLGLKHDPELLVQLALTLAFKRLIDIGAATVGLIASAPIALLVAAAILLEDGRPILFRQERVGLHGRRFRVVKFRTMHHDAEQSLAELMTRNEVRGQAFKITNDPRVTRVGRFLRRTSLDELPQLWNVLLGEMSLVGPRPPAVRGKRV